MSKGAFESYKQGKLPISKCPTHIKKLVKIIEGNNKGYLACEWHHTSKYYNETYFYNVPVIDYLIKKYFYRYNLFIKLYNELKPKVYHFRSIHLEGALISNYALRSPKHKTFINLFNFFRNLILDYNDESLDSIRSLE